jgi:hypothetical protein
MRASPDERQGGSWFVVGRHTRCRSEDTSEDRAQEGPADFVGCRALHALARRRGRLPHLRAFDGGARPRLPPRLRHAVAHRPGEPSASSPSQRRSRHRAGLALLVLSRAAVPPLPLLARGAGPRRVRALVMPAQGMRHGSPTTTQRCSVRTTGARLAGSAPRSSSSGANSTSRPTPTRRLRWADGRRATGSESGG